MKAYKDAQGYTWYNIPDNYDMNLKPKLNKYVVRLPDGKEVMVKAHDVTCDLRSNTGAGHIYFEKNGNVIYRFKEWTFWRKL